MPIIAAKGWLTGRAAKILLGDRSNTYLLRQVVLGKVRALVEPGRSIMYSKEDVIKLKRERDK